MKSSTARPSNGMQYLMAALAISAGIFFTNVQAADPVPYRGPYAGPVGVGEPRDVMRIPGAQRPAVSAPAAVAGAPVDVVVSTIPRDYCARPAVKKPVAKSALQICRENLAKANKGWDDARTKAKESADNSFSQKHVAWAGILIAAIAFLLGLGMGAMRRRPAPPANPAPAEQAHHQA